MGLYRKNKDKDSRIGRIRGTFRIHKIRTE